MEFVCGLILGFKHLRIEGKYAAKSGTTVYLEGEKKMLCQ